MQLYRHITANNVILKGMPFLREISMEAYLIENSDVLALDADELSTVTVLDDEVPVVDGRPGKRGDGRIDLIAQYGDSTVGVIELKKGELNDNHLLQIQDYMQNTANLEALARKYIDENEIKFVAVLVGDSITAELREKIENGYTIHDSIPVAALTLRRYRGDDNNIYVVTDTYFRNVSRRFDRTKYEFDGNVLSKNRLVLAVINRHVESNPGITYSELEKVFPKQLQGGWGCFTTIEDAQDVYDRTGYKRYFLKPEELIDIKDSKIAVCNQWGLSRIKRFLKRARELGYEIKEIPE